VFSNEPSEIGMKEKTCKAQAKVTAVKRRDEKEDFHQGGTLH
jgi:hypothetical protein